MIDKDLPLMLWDGDCGFCAKWVTRWKKITKDKIQYAPYQSCLKDYPVSGEDCKRAVQLVLPDGTHYQAAEAVFRALDTAGTQKAWLWLYKHIPGFKFFSETVYRFVASHRSWF